MGSAFCDFYTSKLLERGTWNIYSEEGAAAAGVEKSERKYIVTGLSYNFRKLLEFGISKDVSIMNVITWNDYPEGHHLAPEINHNEGFSVLLNYYKSVWKHEPSPYAGRDVAVVFFKKYNHTTVPQPYNFKVVEIEKGIYDINGFRIRFFTERQIQDLATAEIFEILWIKEEYEEPVTLFLVSSKKA